MDRLGSGIDVSFGHRSGDDDETETEELGTEEVQGAEVEVDESQTGPKGEAENTAPRSEAEDPDDNLGKIGGTKNEM